MTFIQGNVDGVWIVEPRVFGDNRGFFMETWSKRELEAKGLYYDFVQDNHSYSAVKGTLRGVHFQRGDRAQAKLLRRVSTEEYGAKAARPKNSRLSKVSLDAGSFTRLPGWEASLARYFDRIKA